MDARFFSALVFSIAVETIVLLFYVRLFCKTRLIPLGQIVFAGWCATFASLPYLWFFVPQFASDWSFWYLGEGLVIAIEAIIIAFCLSFHVGHAITSSVVCNVASLVAGRAILEVLAWLGRT